MTMNFLFQELYSASQAAKEVADHRGRNYGLQLGIVTNNEDPQQQRRGIKVTTASKGAKVETDWLRRICTAPAHDEVLPKVGDTVLFGYIEGDPHRGVYFGVVNNLVNPPLNKENSQKDCHKELEGSLVWKAGKTVRIENEAGAYLELTEGGTIEVGDSFGNTWTLGGGGAELKIAQGSALINGKHQATVGAVDNRGDVLVSKGWS